MVIAVIPAFNEERHIAQVVKKAKKIVDKVIVVNDGSTDQTEILAKKADAIVLTHKTNLGLGASLKTGCDAACYLGGNTIITLDGDSQHNPYEIPKFLKKIGEGYDIVFGKRTKKKKAMPFIKKLGNALSSQLQNLLFKTKLSDIQSGFRAFTKAAYQKIRWEAIGYNVATEIAINTKKKNLTYCQIPIDTIYKDAYKGISPIDGLEIVIDILKKRLKL